MTSPGRAEMPLGAGVEDDWGLRGFFIRKPPISYDIEGSYEKVAATYSPTWWGSTIGDGELNFSVRNGKRWILTAITATVYVLRKITLITKTP